VAAVTGTISGSCINLGVSTATPKYTIKINIVENEDVYESLSLIIYGIVKEQLM